MLIRLCMLLALLAREASASTDRMPLLQDTLGLILANDYASAERSLAERIAQTPNQILPRTLLLFLWQLEMYEHDDFSKEKEFEEESKITLHIAESQDPRLRVAWDYSVLASLYAMEGFFKARQERWVSAARWALKAKSALQRSIELDPDFADAYLGLGLFHYYSSVLGKQYPFLPGLGDHRKQGIEEVNKTLAEGHNLQLLAEFALLYILYDEQRYPEVLSLAQSLSSRFPQNTLLQGWVGWAQMRAGRYDLAAQSFETICALDRRLHHCLYFLGLNRMFANQDPKLVLKHLGDFLATAPTPPWRARAYYRIGTTQLQLGNLQAARQSLLAATFIDPGYKPPRDRLAQMKTP